MANDTEIAIYYFSATGNSLKLSLDIASHFSGTKLFKIGAKSTIETSNAKMVGFIFPVYMGGLPDIVRKLLQKYPFKEDVYYFSIGTYYTYKGCAMSIANKIMADKGISLSYGNCLPSVGNCLKEYEVSANKRIKILERADIETKRIISDLANKRIKTVPKYHHLSDILHKGLFRVFFHNSHLKFTVENTCTSCRVCEKICPVHNIVIEDGTPKWGVNCETCHACVHGCPQHAINIGKSKGRLQYQHPGIKKTMLFNTK